MRLLTLGILSQAAQVLFAAEWAETSESSLALVERDEGRQGDCTVGRRLMGHGFIRFEWVSHIHLYPSDKLARSSAPHYECDDANQELTDESINLLKKQGIAHVISLNSYALDPAIRNKLKANGIDYTPIPVRDYGTPTLTDLQKGYKAFRETTKGATLVWCGYGHGRSGVMVTAIEMFREAEKVKQYIFNRGDYRMRYIETQPQRAVLDKLQELLKPGGASKAIYKAMSAHHQAVGAFNRFRAATSADSKASLKSEAITKVQYAVDLLSEASMAVDFHWRAHRALFDRYLDALAKGEEAQDSDPSEALTRLKNNVLKRTQSATSLPVLADEIGAIGDALRGLIKDPEDAARPSETASPRHRTETEIAEEIDLAEGCRSIVGDLYTRIHDQVGNLRKMVLDMFLVVFDPNDLVVAKKDLQNLRAAMDKIKKKALATETVAELSILTTEARKTFEKAEKSARALAEMIDRNPVLGSEEFAEARRMMHDMRIQKAEIAARAARQFVKEYVVETWRKKQEAAAEDVDVHEEAARLSEMAFRVQAYASSMGGKLMDKANCLTIIKSVLDTQNPGLDDSFGAKAADNDMDDATAVQSTNTIWLKNKEPAAEALEHERQTLKSEMNTMQAPIHAFVTTSVMIKREANLAMVVAAQAEDKGDSEQEMLEWRKSALQSLIDTLREDLHEQREAEKKKAKEKLILEEQARELEQGQKTKHWHLELGLEIGLAVLAALPMVTAPVADVLLWARQAIRISRFLRSVLSVTTDAAVSIANQAGEVIDKLGEVLENWRLAVPASTRDWASDKSPTQIIERLKGLRLAEERPAKSVEDLMQDLESISVPEHDPADEMLDKPLSKLLKKLGHVEVPIEPPAAARVPEAAQRRARRSVPELMRELQTAAKTPHHSSDVAFKKLLDEAAAYIPDDYDVNHRSLAFHFVQHISTAAAA